MSDSPSWITWPATAATTIAPAGAVSPLVKPEKPKRAPAEWRPMTDLEKRAAKALVTCRLPPATSTKRIAGHLYGQACLSEPRITDKQARYLWQFCWTFRRQIADRGVKQKAEQVHNTQIKET